MLLEPEFSPILPTANTAAARTLDDLCNDDPTQIDWLQSGNGLRLAAAIKALDYLGWEPVSILVQTTQWKRLIACYSLTDKAKQAAYNMGHGGGEANA